MSDWSVGTFDLPREPKAWRAWRRANPDASTWEELSVEAHEAARQRLSRNQGGLCCYCYGVLVEGHTRTEHIRPRHLEDVDIFEFANLALACDGGERAERAPHCDRSKGGQQLAGIHPYTAPVPLHARLRNSSSERGGEGRLQAEEGYEADVYELLNLNEPMLCRARQAALQAQLVDLASSRRRRSRGWSVRRLGAALERLEAREQPVEFHPFVHGWLARRLR